MKLSDINFGLFLEKHRFDVAVLTVLIISHHLGSRKLKNRPWRCFVGAHVNSCKSQRSPWDFTPVMNQRWYRSTMINLDCHKRETNTSKDRYIIWYTYHIYIWYVFPKPNILPIPLVSRIPNSWWKRPMRCEQLSMLHNRSCPILSSWSCASRKAIEHAKWERWDEMFEIFDVYPGGKDASNDATNTLKLFVATLAIFRLWRRFWWLFCKLEVARIWDLSSANMLLDSQMLHGIVETELSIIIWDCHMSHLWLNLTERPPIKSEGPAHVKC